MDYPSRARERSETPLLSVVAVADGPVPTGRATPNPDNGFGRSMARRSGAVPGRRRRLVPDDSRTGAEVR